MQTAAHNTKVKDGAVGHWPRGEKWRRRMSSGGRVTHAGHGRGMQCASPAPHSSIPCCSPCTPVGPGLARRHAA